MAYELNKWPCNRTNNFPLIICVFGTGKLVRKAVKSKFTYNDQGIACDGERSWSFGNGFARNAIIFGVENSSSSHVDNPKNILLVLGKGLTDGINDTPRTAEKKLVLTLVK